MVTHPATSATVEQYVAWYDRHFDPVWADTLLSPPDASGNRVPRAFVLPKTSADVIAIGRAIQTTIFLSSTLRNSGGEAQSQEDSVQQGGRNFHGFAG